MKNETKKFGKFIKSSEKELDEGAKRVKDKLPGLINRVNKKFPNILEWLKNS